MESADLDLSTLKTLKSNWGDIVRLLQSTLPEIFKRLHQNSHKPWEFETTQERTPTFEHSNWNQFIFRGFVLATAPFTLPFALIASPILAMEYFKHSSPVEEDGFFQSASLTEDLEEVRKLLE